MRSSDEGVHAGQSPAHDSRSTELPHPYPFSERGEIVPFVPSGARKILDVGCGRGGFGSGLRRADPTRTIWGIEPDPDSAREARAHYDRVLEGNFPGVLEACDTRFDCVVFNDVLEHMVDPWSAIRFGVDLLVPGGAIIASIPNVRYLRTIGDLVLRGDWHYADCGVLDRTHLRFFTRKTCKTLFRQAGLSIDDLQGINWIGHNRYPRLSRVLPMALGDFAYTGFVVVGRATSDDAGAPARSST